MTYAEALDVAISTLQAVHGGELRDEAAKVLEDLKHVLWGPVYPWPVYTSEGGERDERLRTTD